MVIDAIQGHQKRLFSGSGTLTPVAKAYSGRYRDIHADTGALGQPLDRSC
ncbi:hypothetical protein ACFQL4_16795 [Halosimplex aquaticum]